MYTLYRIRYDGPLHLIHNTNSNKCYYYNENSVGGVGILNPENWWEADKLFDTMTFTADFASVQDVIAYFSLKQLLGATSDQNT